MGTPVTLPVGFVEELVAELDGNYSGKWGRHFGGAVSP